MYKKLKKAIVVGLTALSISSYTNPVNANDTIDEELNEYFSKEHRLLNREKIELSPLAREFNKRLNIEVKKDGIEPGFGYFDLAPDQYKDRSLPDLKFSIFEKETNDLIKKRIEDASKKSLEEYIRRSNIFLKFKQYYEGLTRFNILKRKGGETEIEVPSIKKEITQKDLEIEAAERELKRIKSKEFGLSLSERRREIELESILDKLNESERKIFRYKLKFGADIKLDYDANEYRDFSLILEPFTELKSSLVDLEISYPFFLASDNLNFNNVNDELKIRLSRTIITSFGRFFLTAENRHQIRDNLDISSISLITKLKEIDLKLGYSRDWKNKEDNFSISSIHYITDKTNVEIRSSLNTKGDYAILGILNFNVNPEYFFRDLGERLRLKK